MRTVILLLATSCFSASGVVAQCSCSPTYRDITAHDEFKLAYAVFVGTVTELKKIPRDKDSYTEVVNFKVTRAWKRNMDAKVVITNLIRGCANGFEEKEEWLVYAYWDRDGTLGTLCCCSRTKRFSRAAEDLKSFDTDGEKPTKILSQQVQPTAGRTTRWTGAAGAPLATNSVRRRLNEIAPPGQL